MAKQGGKGVNNHSHTPHFLHAEKGHTNLPTLQTKGLESSYPAGPEAHRSSDSREQRTGNGCSSYGTGKRKMKNSYFSSSAEQDKGRLHLGKPYVQL